MSRRKNHASLARPKLADQRFNSVVVEQLIKMLMISGKKQKANQIVGRLIPAGTGYSYADDKSANTAIDDFEGMDEQIVS